MALLLISVFGSVALSFESVFYCGFSHLGFTTDNPRRGR